MDELSQFEQLIMVHLDAAYNLARWLMQNKHDAEDIVQEASIRAFRAFSSFRGSNGKAWLLTIVRNLCYNALKKNHRHEPAASFDEDLHSMAQEVPGSLEMCWETIKMEWLNQAMEKLPVEYREIIVMHSLENMSYKEISSAIDIPMGTVMSRLSRARKKLQEEILTLARKEES